MSFSPTVGLASLGLGVLGSRLSEPLLRYISSPEKHPDENLYDKLVKAINKDNIDVVDLTKNPEYIADKTGDDKEDVRRYYDYFGAAYSAAGKDKDGKQIAPFINMVDRHKTPSVLAHEYGHALTHKAHGDLRQAIDSYSDASWGPKAAVLSFLTNSILAATGSDYKTMGAVAAANALVNAPGTIGEIEASYRGAKKLNELGGSFMNQVRAFGGVPSRLTRYIAPVVPMLVKAIYDKYK